MSESWFAVETLGGVSVVTTPEEIDITNAGELRAALLHAAAHSRGPIVVDMSRTQFCDSSGLHALVLAHKRARAESDELLVVIAATAVRRIFAISGLDRVIPGFSSLGDALAQGSVSWLANSGSALTAPDLDPIPTS